MTVTGPASAVITVVGGEPINSSAAFLEVAQELSRAAQVLSSSNHSSAIGFALLAGHAAELALKSFLLARGVQPEQFRHDLLQAWQVAHAHGLPIPQTPPEWLRTIASLHGKPYLLRYPHQNSGFVFPPLAECAAELSALLEHVRRLTSGCS